MLRDQENEQEKDKPSHKLGVLGMDESSNWDLDEGIWDWYKKVSNLQLKDDIIKKIDNKFTPQMIFSLYFLPLLYLTKFGTSSKSRPETSTPRKVFSKFNLNLILL